MLRQAIWIHFRMKLKHYTVIIKEAVSECKYISWPLQKKKNRMIVNHLTVEGNKQLYGWQMSLLVFRYIKRHQVGSSFQCSDSWTGLGMMGYVQLFSKQIITPQTDESKYQNHNSWTANQSVSPAHHQDVDCTGNGQQLLCIFMLKCCECTCYCHRCHWHECRCWGQGLRPSVQFYHSIWFFSQTVDGAQVLTFVQTIHHSCHRLLLWLIWRCFVVNMCLVLKYEVCRNSLWVSRGFWNE